MAEVVLYSQNGQPYRFAIADDGKRALLRNYRATNASDAGRIRTATWEYATPIGYSDESASRALGCDYAQNLETRFPGRLISKGARTAVTLTSSDPQGVSNTSKLGEFKLGSVTNKLGGTVSTSSNVTHFAEQGGYILAFRNRLATLVRISDWSVRSTTIMPEAVTDAVSWHGKVRVGLGTNAVMKTLVGVSSTGATFADTQTLLGDSVYASSLAVGSDRCWFGTRSVNGQLENQISYTLNDFETMANPFTVGDPMVHLNGIGPLGPFTFYGFDTGLFAATDQGKPVPLSRALVGHSSNNNGEKWADPGWGWNYTITDIGLRACTSHIDNPVGPGEAMRQFTGHGGRPTAIFAERGEMFVVYNDGGNLYAYRCTFGPETANTGQPLFYPWWYKASTACQAIFSTNTPANTALMWGEGTNMAYETISRDGRDDLFDSRSYDTGGGTWYGTKLDRDPHMLKVLRLNRVHAKSMTSGSTWTVAWSFDGGTYLDMPVVTDTGYHIVRPVGGSPTAPLSNISGHTLKPRITQVAAGSGASTSPPELEGTLEIEYDERPTFITEVGLTIDLGKTQGMSKEGLISTLESLLTDETTGPIKVRLPDRNVDEWAMVQNATNRRDLKPDAVEGIDLILHIWSLA